MITSVKEHKLNLEPLKTTDEFQRLEKIALLGALNKVIPHSPQNRKDHSLEVSYLTSLWLARQNGSFTHNETRHIVAHALLHDIGQTPYSHELEKIAQKDQIAMNYYLLNKPSLSMQVQGLGLDKVKLGQMLTKKESLSKIVADKFGMDKIAYVAGDSDHLGFGKLEGTDTLLENISYDKHNGLLLLARKGEEAAVEHAERYVDLHVNAYFHPQSLANKHLLSRMMYSLLKGEEDKEAWQEWVDEDVDEYISQVAKNNGKIASLWNNFSDGDYMQVHNFSPHEKKSKTSLSPEKIAKLKSLPLDELAEIEDDICHFVYQPIGSVVLANDGNIKKASLPDIMLAEEKKMLFSEMYPTFTKGKVEYLHANLDSVYVLAKKNIAAEIPAITHYLSIILNQ